MARAAHINVAAGRDLGNGDGAQEEGIHNSRAEYGRQSARHRTCMADHQVSDHSGCHLLPPAGELPYRPRRLAQMLLPNLRPLPHRIEIEVAPPVPPHPSTSPSATGQALQRRKILLQGRQVEALCLAQALAHAIGQGRVLMQDLEVQLIGPPVSVRRAGARRVRERAFCFG